MLTDSQHPRPRRVLLVDDYADALEMWRVYLEMHGCVVATAPDGQTALALTGEFHPDIIVLDLELPGLTGLDAARDLRRAAETSSIPLIAATGYSSSHQIAEATTAGFNLVLIKPCDPAILYAEIERLAPFGPDMGEEQRTAANG